MMNSLSSKLGIQKGMRGIFINVPANEIKKINRGELDLSSRLSGYLDYIHFFAKSLTELNKKFPSLRDHLKPTGILWISWPKGGQQSTDLTLAKIIKVGYDHGLVESKTVSVDDDWSAIKFTHPKKGKIYNNKYGKLKI